MQTDGGGSLGSHTLKRQVVTETGSRGPMNKATVLPAGLASMPHLLISSAPMWNSRSVDVRPRTTPFTDRLQGSDTNCTR